MVTKEEELKYYKTPRPDLLECPTSAPMGYQDRTTRETLTGGHTFEELKRKQT